MKKITFLIMLFSSIISFSQEQVMLDIDFLLNDNGNGSLRISNSSYQVLYESYGARVDNYGQIINLTIANFPLIIEWRPGHLGTSCQSFTKTYTYNDYLSGIVSTYGCAPEYFYIRSPYINQLTAATATKGVCENINLATGARHYYSTTGNAPWILCPFPFSAATLLGSNYRGPLHIKSDMESFYANPKVTMQSKVITFNIIGCSPALDGQPIPENTKCKFQSTGSAVIKFKTPLITGEKILFNLFKDGAFDKSLFVAKEQIINNTYTWTGLAEGTYYIKYQSQAIGDGTTLITGNTAIVTDSFPIKSPDALTSTIKDLQPECFNGQGAIQISAFGGTSPYYYKINADPEVEFTTAVTIPKNSGNYTITVRDSQNCIDTSGND
jgi:hypothetical protein